MRIFKPRTQHTPDSLDSYCRLTFTNDPDRKRFHRDDAFRGKPADADLRLPFHVKRMLDFPGGDVAPLADRIGIAFHMDPMALSRRAIDALLPCIGRAGEVLTLDFDEGDYGLFNVTRVIDAIDPAKAEISRFEDGGVNRIRRHAFKPEVIRDEFIFKSPPALRETYVTDRFVELVRRERLTGFRFELLWSSELGLLPPGLADWQRPSITGLEDEPFDFQAFWARHTALKA